MSDPTPARTPPTREQLAEMAVYVKGLEGIVDAANKALRGALLDELRTMHDSGDGKTIDATALGIDDAAKITLAVPEKGAYKVIDEEAFRNYVDLIAPDQIEMVFVVDPKWQAAFLKSLALDQDGAVVNPAGGDALVPGVTYEPPAAPSKFSITIDKAKTADVAERVLESITGLADTVSMTKALGRGA